MKFNRTYIARAILCFAICVGLFFSPVLQYLEKSRDSEVVSILRSLGTAEDNYFAAYREYSADSEKLGFSLNASGTQMFFLKERVPVKYLDVLGEQNMPFVEKDKYRILVVVERTRHQVEFWTMDKQKIPTKLSKEKSDLITSEGF